jgi:dipeptidyl aminopeptidase/acylaminoacyl peptidase
MDKFDKPYEWLSKKKEGHGFRKEENVIEVYKLISKFLDKHIGDS